MTTQSLNVFTVTLYLCFFFSRCHGFEVIQSLNETTVISCAHTADNQSDVIDVRLYSVSKGRKQSVCQKGMEKCENMVMLKKNPNKFLFIFDTNKPKDVDVEYQCEFTVTVNEIHETKCGEPFVSKKLETLCPSPPSPSPPSPSPELNPFNWILIGLVLLILLYGFIITVMYFRLKSVQTMEPERCTYVEMRKAPMMPHPIYDPYSMCSV